MPNPIQATTDALHRLESQNVTGQAAFIKAMAIRELERVRDEFAKFKSEQVKSDRIKDGELESRINQIAEIAGREYIGCKCGQRQCGLSFRHLVRRLNDIRKICEHRMEKEQVA